MANPFYGAVGGRVPGPTIDYGQQAPTLAEARRPMGMLLPREPLESTPGGLFEAGSQPDMRRAWYIRKLGKFHAQLQESAAANAIPPRLLAAIILNELADINWKDGVQFRLTSLLNSGSLGIAQIQVRTALDHGLLKGFLVGRHAGTAAQLLAIAQYSIEAAAREIRHLVGLMESKPDAAWPAFFQFVPPAAGDRDPQRYYRPGVITLIREGKDLLKAQVDREAFFARMITSAYNGGDNFLQSADPAKSQPNSYKHGVNGEFIARDLFEFDLFG